MDKEEFLTRADFNDALVVQNACNLSGVVHDFSRIVTKIWNEARRQHQGTDWVNNHPISVLFADKIASLAGVQGLTSNSYETFSKAFKTVQEIINEYDNIGEKKE